MNAATAELLLSPAGLDLLASLPPYQEADALRLSEQLRAHGHPAALVAAVLTQSRLQSAAQAKFGSRADTMAFTQAGLEQATRPLVAAGHAARFAQAGCQHILDATAGIGTDAVALAAAGLCVTAVEIDRATALFAGYNLREIPEATVIQADALQLDPADLGVDGIFADPARRTDRGRRVFDPNAYSPPLGAVEALRHRVPALGVKVGPGVSREELPEDAEAEWVSIDGSVVETALWHGPLAPEGPGRSATVMRSGHGGGVRQTRVRATSDELAADPEVVHGPDDLDDFLVEPDGAIIRSGLVGPLAHRFCARLLDPTIAYLSTTDPLAEASLGTSYRVLDTMPFNLKRLKAYLRQRDIGRLTIKKRGTAVTPELLRPRLALRGDASATVVLTRVAGAQHALVVEPVSRRSAHRPATARPSPSLVQEHR